jgi:hypothetical protein
MVGLLPEGTTPVLAVPPPVAIDEFSLEPEAAVSPKE